MKSKELQFVMSSYPFNGTYPLLPDEGYQNISRKRWNSTAKDLQPQETRQIQLRNVNMTGWSIFLSHIDRKYSSARKIIDEGDNFNLE